MAASDPTVLWRLVNNSTSSAHARHEWSRAVMLPGGPPHTIAFFINETMDRVENYDSIDLALFRAEDVKRSLVDQGWKEDS